jgi:hypothetical protein
MIDKFASESPENKAICQEASSVDKAQSYENAVAEHIFLHLR